MFRVLRSGLQTTFQDLGRPSFRDMGVPLSGVMDQNLATFSNALLGNSQEAVVVEFTVIGPVLEVLENIEIAICGMGLNPICDHQPIPANQKVLLQRGQQVNLGAVSGRMRGYLSVSGGFDVPKVLGSSSYYPGFLIPKIEKGSVLKANRIVKNSIQSKEVLFDYKRYNSEFIQVTEGPEIELLDDSLKQELYDSTFKINSQSNRMAIVFDNALSGGLDEIITAPVQPGTVQLMPSGKLVVLMRDAQATGGYARIFQLTTKAINLLSQKIPGTEIRFELI